MGVEKLTVINNSYEFKCVLCNTGVEFTELEKGKTFTAYELKCNSCTHSGYMFSVFVPTHDDLLNLIDQYKRIIKNVGMEEQ